MPPTGKAADILVRGSKRDGRLGTGRRARGLLLVGCACLVASTSLSYGAELSLNDLQKLRLELAKQQEKLHQQEEAIKQQEATIVQQTLRLDAQARLMERQLGVVRGAGSASGAAELNPQAPAAGTAQVAQSAPAASTPESAPITGPSRRKEQARRVLETTPALQSGGVLTPRGQLVIDPSIEYDYWNQNKLALNGFTIIPGITFGNIFISKQQQNIVTGAVTLRYGVTNRLELNVKIPYVYNYSTWTAQEAGPGAQFLFSDAQNHSIGDIQFGASYQFNSAESGWPIFVGNLVFKTATGVSPFDVPIITVNDPNGQFLEGIPKRTPTGTGFYAVEPSLTILYPTAPGVWFANFQYIYNIPRTLDIPDVGGGPGIPTHLSPGGAIAATFGIGFALNDRASLTLSYQQQHEFSSSAAGQTIPGSSFDFGTFNFAVGYQISRRTSINLGIGIGAGPNAPAAKILLEVPIRFNLL